MVTAQQARQLDPTLPAAPVVMPRDPGRDLAGHGRTIPLVGGQRPYLLEVVFDNGTQRVYADRMEDALSAIIDGYAAKITEVDEAQGNPDRTRGAIAEAWLARFDHASQLRRSLQARINDEARIDGAWDTLDDEEREQCELSAAPDTNSEPPVGVIFEVPVDTPYGGSDTQEVGFWLSRDVKLVVNRGDYGILDDRYLEPQSWLETEGPDGRAYVIEGVWPPNMVILDPTTDESYLESLTVAGLVEVTVIPSDLPDEVFQGALQIGRDLIASETGNGPSDQQ